MKTGKICIGLMMSALLIMGSFQVAFGGNNGGVYYDVTITNVTKGTNFTPILVATHNSNMAIFMPGHPARPELASLALGGATDPLGTLLGNSPNVGDVQVGVTDHPGGLLEPGKSVTVTVMGGGQFKHVSLAGMLLPTNDGFVGLNGIATPKGNKVRKVMALGYDAGVEDNDESCANIPGPTCGGSGAQDTDGEGYVHVHAGIHGMADVDVTMHDWRNPVAMVMIRRVQ